MPNEEHIRVLVVDDSPMDRRLASALLNKAGGFDVEIAEDGRAALAAIEKRAVDVIVTDLHMPEMDGLELVGVVRDKFANLPVVLMTAHGSEETAVEALRHGATSYVPKRNLAKELAGTLRDIVSVARANRAQRRVLDTLIRSHAEYSITNEPSELPTFIAHLEQQLAGLRLCDEASRMQVGVALREALANAIYHGNLEVSSKLKEGGGDEFESLAAERRRAEPYRDRRVRVMVTLSKRSAEFEIEDQGPGFDSSDLPDPLDPNNLDKEYGRGLMLIRMFMDEVEHNETGNVIRMVKHASPPSRPPPSMG